ncbi:hypothetical protein HJG60_010375 [Phyllostomus discolor]|uniref:Uncharacterized protein n=1 Tax=Phyllostomus discolor TaxID=89673 RepID=A0A834EKB7_9CHIR|nr:hypothetical protein HJG60_010375 [Phyllostomus discolor]
MCHFVTQDMTGQQLWTAWLMQFGTTVLWVQKRNHVEKPGACTHVLGYQGSTSTPALGQKGFLCPEKVSYLHVSGPHGAGAQVKGLCHPPGSSGELQVTPKACSQNVWKRKAQIHMAAPERAAWPATVSEFCALGRSCPGAPGVGPQGPQTGALCFLHVFWVF